MVRFQRPLGNLSVITLKKKMGQSPILILQVFNRKTYNYIFTLKLNSKETLYHYKVNNHKYEVL